MINDYWENKTRDIIDKYISLMKNNRIVFNDIFIGVKCCYMYNSLELERRCVTATKMHYKLCGEINKFPKYCRGIIYSTLRKFKL